jgi:hypothetical protein
VRRAIAGPKSRSSGSIGSRGCQGPLDVGSGSGQALRSGRVLRSLRRCVCAASEEVRGAIGLRHGVDLRSTGRSLTGQANAATVAPVFIWCDRTARVRRRFKSRCNSTAAALWIRPRRTYKRRSMQRPASCRWQKVVLGVRVVHAMRGGQHPGRIDHGSGANTRRAAIDTGVVAWNAARRRVTSRVSHLTPRWRKPDRTRGPPQERHRRPIRQYADFFGHNG